MVVFECPSGCEVKLAEEAPEIKPEDPVLPVMVERNEDVLLE